MRTELFRPDRRRDKKNLIVAFHTFANAQIDDTFKPALRVFTNYRNGINYLHRSYDRLVGKATRCGLKFRGFYPGESQKLSPHLPRPTKPPIQRAPGFLPKGTAAEA